MEKSALTKLQGGMDLNVKGLRSYLKRGLKCSVDHCSYDGYRALQAKLSTDDKA